MNPLWSPDAIPGTRDNALAPAPTWADAAAWHGQNLADTWQAVQQPQTWVDAGHQYANAMLMGTAAPGPAGIAARIGRYAEKMGYSVSRDSSKLSGSEYLGLTHEKLPDSTLKLRISDHNLPPSYGAPGDLDVHAGTPREESVGWSDAVKRLADRIGVTPPSAASLAADTKAATLNSFDGQVALLRKAFPGEPILRNPRSYASQYEAANPGKVPWTPHFGLDRK